MIHVNEFMIICSMWLIIRELSKGTSEISMTSLGGLFDTVLWRSAKSYARGRKYA